MAGSLVGIFLECVDRYRKPVQFMRKSGTRWESISGERALSDVESVAHGLRELGIERGDHVAILSETRYEWALSDLAIMGLGAVTVTIYPTLTASQCQFILHDSESKAAIVSTPAQRDKVLAVRDRLPRLKMVIGFDHPSGPPSEAPPGAMHERPAPGFQDLYLDQVMGRGESLRQREPNAFRQSAGQVGPDDIATIIYTSGTTGEPKGAMLTHGNIVSNVDACLQVLGLERSDTCLSFLPLSHIFERMAGLYVMLRAGATIAYAESFAAVSANAVEVRPSILIGVPRFYEKAYERVMANARTLSPLQRRIFSWGLEALAARARARFDGPRLSPLGELKARVADLLVARRIRARLGGQLRCCVSGSAALSTQVIEFFFAIGIPVIEGYGLTETSPVITMNPPGRQKPGSVGPPAPGVEVRISAEGEILTRGPHVMRGYYKNDEATRRAIRDGWFHTGDVGHIDPDGYLVITDRLKDLLVTAGGKKVAPQPLEAKLRLSPWISEAVLLGEGRPYVVALIVPQFERLKSEAAAHPWSIASDRELIERPEVKAIYQGEIDRLNRDLAPFEQVKRFTLLDRELSQEADELTPSLKVKRKVVMAHYATAIEALYSADRAAGVGANRAS